MRPQNALFDRTETPGRGKRRHVTWKRYMIVFVALVMTLVSSSFFIIKTHAAGGSGESSNLSNRYLGLQNDVFPGRLYRGDGRSPDDIFANGFTAKGKDYDLERHLNNISQGGSGYISTTGQMDTALTSAQTNGKMFIENIAGQAKCSISEEFFYTFIPKIGQFLLGNCTAFGNRRVVIGRTYVYEIDPAYAQNAFYVPTAIRPNSALYSRYASEDEWAYVNRIPPQAIVGAHLYQWTAYLNPDGSVNQNTATFDDLNQFVANPNYGGTTGQNPHYNPGNDTQSGWGFDTDPDLPTSSCPTNPNVYQHCS